MTLLRLSFLALLVACGGEKDPVDTGDTDVPTGDDDDDDEVVEDTYTPVTEDCGDAAPVITVVTASNGGMVDPGTGGAQVPALLLTIDATDADGDLHELGFEIDLDTTVDGTLDPAGTVAGTGSVAAEECGAPALQLQLSLAIDGAGITYDTHYEFGVRLLDAAGHASNTFLIDAITPNADGTDGDGI